MTQLLQAPGFLDYLSEVQSPVRLQDISTHPGHAGWAADPPPMKAFLGMPIHCDDEHVGAVCLAKTDGDQDFTEEDQDTVAMLAAHAASVIHNSRRYEDEHRAKVDLETLLDISPVAFSVFDARVGEVTYINQESRRLLDVMGLLDGEVENVYEIIRFTTPDGREVPFVDLPGTRTLQTGETVRAEEIVCHLPNGDNIRTLVNCAPLFSQSGEIVSVMSVMLDMTPVEDLERKRAEFLGVVSEELRTPVISIKGSAAALRELVEPMHSTESMQLLRIIDQQADLMRSQLNSLIELTQIESGTLSVATESTDVAALIERSCGEYLRDHAAIAIEFDIPDRLPTVLADRHRIGQVLHNFLRQAGKYSNELSAVKVSASALDIHVAISVLINGSFAPSEITPSPFGEPETPELFRRITHAHNRAAEMSSQGEGLALAYCRGVVEAHGGRITTDINEEGGTLTLTFTLPTVEDEVAIPVPESRTIPGEISAVPVETTQILVSVEDPGLLRTVRQVLLNEGYGVVAAPGLNEVEELVPSARPKLILLDIAGREEESFRILRGPGNPLNLPAIVLCDRNDEEYVVHAFDMGADGYMVKPFSPSELVARIRATLRRSNRDAESVANRTYQLADVRIDFDERTVNVSGQSVPVTATEYKLLDELTASAGRVMTQDMLLQRVWGPEYSGESQLLRSYIKSLRQKLGDNARKPTYIFTEHGVGYRMARPEPPAGQ